MKKFLSLILLCLLVLTVGCSKTQPGQVQDVLALRQVVAQDNATSRTIMWQSSKPHEQPQVEYRLAGQAATKTINATEDIFTDDKVKKHIFTARLQKLQPSQKYEYRVGYGKERGQWETLTTAGAANFKALIFPDSQSSDYSGWKKLAASAWQNNNDASFFINMGDLVDNGESEHQWNEWFAGISPFSAKIPLAPVMGNHEAYSLDWKMRLPLAYVHYFQLPVNNASKFQNQYYSFDYGDVHFAVLNTQMQETVEFQPDMLDTQIAWLKQDMTQSTKKWKVVLMHKDVLQYSFATRKTPRPEGISEEGKIFMPLFDELGVDAVLSAHLHTYRRRGHIKNFLRDPKGPEYILTGVSGNVVYPNLWKQHGLDEYVAPQPETNNYIVMEVSDKGLGFTCFLPSGEKLDTVLVSKP